MRVVAGLVVLLGAASASWVFSEETKEKQVEAFFADLAKAAQAGDAAAYARLFSPDATMFLPHRRPLVGRAEIGQWFARFRDAVALVLDSYDQERRDIVGDVAIVRSRGVGHYLVKSTGEKIAFDQKYLDILRYENGVWSMVYHVASSSTFDTGLWDRDWEKQ